MLCPICIRCWILLGLAIVSWGIGGAHAASLEAYATAIASADQQRQALEQMREVADPSFKDLLIALKEGSLYTWQGRLLILNDSGVLNDLAGQGLLDASGEPFLPDDAQQVPLEAVVKPCWRLAEGLAMQRSWYHTPTHLITRCGRISHECRLSLSNRFDQ
jgi:hypothetical protein